MSFSIHIYSRLRTGTMDRSMGKWSVTKYNPDGSIASYEEGTGLPPESMAQRVSKMSIKEKQQLLAQLEAIGGEK